MKEPKMDEMLELDDDELENAAGGANTINSNCPYCGCSLIKVYADGLCPRCKRSVVSGSGTTNYSFLS